MSTSRLVGSVRKTWHYSLHARKELCGGKYDQNGICRTYAGWRAWEFFATDFLRSEAVALWLVERAYI